MDYLTLLVQKFAYLFFNDRKTSMNVRVHSLDYDNCLANRLYATDYTKHPASVPDNSKIGLLYAQMHKVASENPTATILFDFYDDKESILKNLLEFYQEHLHLIPTNVALSIYQYDGKQLGRVAPVLQGQGEIDRNYKETIKSIAAANNNYLIPVAIKSFFDIKFAKPEVKIADASNPVIPPTSPRQALSFFSVAAQPVIAVVQASGEARASLGNTQPTFNHT
jgi:hypothetical protein